MTAVVSGLRTQELPAEKEAQPNETVGDEAVYKGLLDRHRPRDAERGGRRFQDDHEKPLRGGHFASVRLATHESQETQQRVE